MSGKEREFERPAIVSWMKRPTEDDGHVLKEVAERVTVVWYQLCSRRAPS